MYRRQFGAGKNFDPAQGAIGGGILGYQTVSELVNSANSNHSSFGTKFSTAMRECSVVHKTPTFTMSYLRNCDYTLKTLQDNLPKALKSVEISTIRKWERRMARWMDAYRRGMTAKNAQFYVRTYSSKGYKSHRRVPEHLACQFDQ